MAAAAAPPVAPIGIFPQFVAQNYEQLVIKEKVFSLSGDSFTVKTVDGREILQVQGDVISLSGRKHVFDMQGVPLFDLRKQLIAFHATYFCENPNGERFFDVKSKFSSRFLVFVRSFDLNPDCLVSRQHSPFITF
jgi:uncharacterized protein YxjI